PARCSHTGSVSSPWSRPKPPSGGAIDSTPWLCAYWPVRNVARDGQHSDSETNECSNVVPAAPISARVRGIAAMSATVWSSVSITTTFGAAEAVAGTISRASRTRTRGRRIADVRMGAGRRRDMTELLPALFACFLAALVANWRLLHPGVVSADALVHQYWMWHWKDAALFNDPLTAELRHSARYPDGYQALFWVVSHVMNPIAFGEWLG